MDRRGFLKGMAGILASGIAPAALPSGIIMPIRQIIVPQSLYITGTQILATQETVIDVRRAAEEELRIFVERIESETFRNSIIYGIATTNDRIKELKASGMITGFLDGECIDSAHTRTLQSLQYMGLRLYNEKYEATLHDRPVDSQGFPLPMKHLKWG